MDSRTKHLYVVVEHCGRSVLILWALLWTVLLSWGAPPAGDERRCRIHLVTRREPVEICSCRREIRKVSHVFCFYSDQLRCRCSVGVYRYLQMFTGVYRGNRLDTLNQENPMCCQGAGRAGLQGARQGEGRPGAGRSEEPAAGQRGGRPPRQHGDTQPEQDQVRQTASPTGSCHRPPS